MFVKLGQMSNKTNLSNNSLKKENSLVNLYVHLWIKLINKFQVN
jgi:hypothetical protein